MRNRNAGAAFVLLGVVLLSAALLLFLRTRGKDAQASASAQTALEGVHSAMETTRADAFTEPSLEKTEPVETAVTEPSVLDSVLVDGEMFIGYLSIPDFELEIPIHAECSMDLMEYAPCLEFGAPQSDDAVIAGHNYDQHFGPLQRIQPGQTVSFTYTNSFVVDYTVQAVKILDPTLVYDVVDSAYDLVLYTCTTGGTSRVVVFCDRVNPIEIH